MKKLFTVLAMLLVCATLATVVFAEDEDRQNSPVVDVNAEGFDLSEPLEIVSAADIIPSVEFGELDEALAEIIDEFVLVITDLVVISSEDSDSADDADSAMLAMEGTSTVDIYGTVHIYEEGLNDAITAHAEEVVTGGQLVASFDLSLDHLNSDAMLSLPTGTQVTLELELPTNRGYVVLHDLGVAGTEVIDGVTTNVIVYNGTNVETLDATYVDGKLSFAVNSSSPFSIVAMPLSLTEKSPDTGVSVTEISVTTTAQSTSSAAPVLLFAGVITLAAVVIAKKAFAAKQ